MIILGIDPGLERLGYGIIKKENNKLTAIAYGIIHTTKEDSEIKRLHIIGKDIQTIIDQYKPDAACIEELFFCKNVTNGLSVSQARGIVIYMLEDRKIPIYQFKPVQIKQAVTSFGQADKKQVQQMVQIILKLDKLPEPDDAADALAAAICGSAVIH